jgi:hypothetical protein
LIFVAQIQPSLIAEKPFFRSFRQSSLAEPIRPAFPSW